MLHAPTNEANNEMIQTKVSFNSTRGGSANPSAATGGSDCSLNPGGVLTGSPALRHRVIAGAQSTYGNRAVLRMLNHSISSTPHVLQRKCACDGSGGDCAQCDEKKESTLQRRAANHAEPNGIPPIVHEVLGSPGRPLDAGTRAFMEPRFGYDFGGVRIHADQRAAESARAVNALAYTVGDHIVLGAAQYAPHTSSTKRLLAHELTHVIQQQTVSGLQGFRISSPGDPLEKQAALAEAAVMSDQPTPPLSAAASTLQRQTGDPFSDPLGDAKKEEKALDPKTKRVYEACPDTCKTFTPVEIAPDIFVTLCNDEIASGSAKMGDPKEEGCTPGRLGMVRLTSGTPAWQMPKAASADCSVYSYCTPHEIGKKEPNTSQIEIGYIQTIENVLSGGVYFKRDAAGKWVWAGNQWECLKNVRDGEAGSKEPWYGKASGSAGPKPYLGCPLISDSPWVRLASGLNVKCIDNLYNRPEWQLRRLRIDGTFHVWLIAKVKNGPPVYIHNWTISDWVVFELNDGADPCHSGGWMKVADEKKVISKGPLKGSATPVLTGKVPAEMDQKAKDCSTPAGADLKDELCKGMKVQETKDEKKK